MLGDDMTEQNTDERSFILIMFDKTASVALQVSFNNVTPLQVLASASYLELRGKNELVQQENERMRREAEQSLAKPKPGILIPNR